MPLIEPGQPAPDFALKDQHGHVRRLSEFRGRAVVIYFYPEDDTPLCTDEACGFRDGHPDFAKVKAVVLGISPDDPASHAAFVRKFSLPFTLLADPPGTDGNPRTSCEYGVWREKVLYGRRYFGMVRSTYLIGPDGLVMRRWDHVRVKGHAEKVLDALRGSAEVKKTGDRARPPDKRNPGSMEVAKRVAKPGARVNRARRDK